ncbi:MAG: ABC transporter permease [Huintestinicola sp.]
MQKKLNIVLLIINMIILAFFVTALAVISSYKKNYSADEAKKSWDNDTYSYGQISLFISPDEGLDINGIYSLKSSIDGKLTENSIALPEGSSGRLWIDSWYTETKLTVSGNMGSAEVLAAGTGGDFFTFHPLDLMYGSYYTDEDINFDRIVLDKECSWQIFGAVDTVGMPVTINGKIYYVAAVVDSPNNSLDKTAYGTSPHVYLPYTALTEINPDSKITLYEVCMPNAVKDFACGIVKELNPCSEKKSFIKDQSGRFDTITLFSGFRKISENAMITTNVSFPWFENIIRGAEIKAQLWAGPAVYLMLVPLISSVYGLFLLVKLGGKGIKKAKDAAEKKYQQKISEEYFKKRSAQSK